MLKDRWLYIATHITFSGRYVKFIKTYYEYLGRPNVDYALLYSTSDNNPSKCDGTFKLAEIIYRNYYEKQ